VARRTTDLILLTPRGSLKRDLSWEGVCGVATAADSKLPVAAGGGEVLTDGANLARGAATLLAAAGQQQQ